MYKPLLSQQEPSAPATVVLAEQLMQEILVSAQIAPSAIKFPKNAFEVLNFHLGDSILPLMGADSETGELPSPELAAREFYLVGSGRVRVLCHDPQSSRDVTACRLDASQWFGADPLLCPQGWSPYQVIGASDGQVFRVSPALLKQWLEDYPTLLQHLATSTRQYQRVIFFRTQTSLKSQPGAQIRTLAEKACDRIIPAGTVLAQYAERYPGRFWLRHGIIAGAQGEPPAVGESWGYDLPIPAEWRAQTDLWTHHLSIEACEALGIAALASASKRMGIPAQASLAGRLLISGNEISRNATSHNEASRNGVGRNGRISPNGRNRASHNGTSSPLEGRPKPSENSQATSPKVVFPKPVRRRVLDRLRRFPWIEQQSSSDCGAACLAMIARYWSKPLPINLLRTKARVGRSGASLKGLARAAESVGFQARPVRASLGRIANQTNPWIAHWQGNHYVVVYKVSRRHVIVADPAEGRRCLSRKAFEDGWTGYALLLDPTERLRETKVQQASLGRYFQALLPYRGLIGQIIVVSILIQVFSLVSPLFTQIILDRVVVQKSASTLNAFAIGLLLFSFWGLLMSSVRRYLLSSLSNRLDLTLISGFIKHALSLPIAFFESRRVGDIITRVQENQKIQRFLIGQVVLAWLNLVTGLVYLGLMLYYNTKLTLIILGLIPPIVIITLGSTPFLRRMSREVFKEAAEQNSTLVEMINGISTIKSVGAEQEVRWRWEDILTKFKNVVFKGQKLGIWLQSINGGVNTIGSTFLLWIGATMVIQDQLTIGQFVAFNMMKGYVISPVLALANLWDELQEVFISIERLNDVFESQPEEMPNQHRLTLPVLKGEIEFEGVTFRYDEDGDRNTLENLSFRVPPGQTVAIVGRSGSGKTTLIKLLEGLYTPQQGRVLVDGHDIRHVSPPSLRSQLGVVPQEVFLFSGTISENITLYRPEHQLEQVIEASKLAEAHAFVQAMTLGYNTPVGEKGSSLSGGQRQRIAIARALLGNPRVLILDEATSSLDTESERRFQRNLAQISRERTTFIIAHRLSTVRNADQILVLDRGVLVEQGTHDELMAQKGLYFTLAQQQLDI